MFGGIASYSLFTAVQTMNQTNATPSIDPVELQNTQNEVNQLKEEITRLEEEKTKLQDQIADNFTTIKELQLEAEEKEPVVSDLTTAEQYEAILYDQTKLTVQNCNYVTDYAEDKEDDALDQVDEFEEEIVDLNERLIEYQQQLVTAIASGDQGEIDRIDDKVDRTEEDIDDAEDEIESLRDDYGDIRRLRVKAEYECKRLERNL